MYTFNDDMQMIHVVFVYSSISCVCSFRLNNRCFVLQLIIYSREYRFVFCCSDSCN